LLKEELFSPVFPVVVEWGIFPKKEDFMNLVTLTYINTLVIAVVLGIALIILYAIRKGHNELLLRIDERSNLTALQTAATLEVARETLRQSANKSPA
jgi:hypothetical protein